jgi:hypothetical protein
MTEKLDRILKTRMKFMRMDWDNVEIELIKTKCRIRFSKTREIDGESYEDSRTIEYGLNKQFTVEEVITDQQRKLGRDIISFVGKENMDEIREVLV